MKTKLVAILLMAVSLMAAMEAQAQNGCVAGEVVDTVYFLAKPAIDINRTTVSLSNTITAALVTPLNGFARVTYYVDQDCHTGLQTNYFAATLIPGSARWTVTGPWNGTGNGTNITFTPLITGSGTISFTCSYLTVGNNNVQTITVSTNYTVARLNVVISNPTNNTVFGFQTPISITADVSADVPVGLVEYFSNNTKIGETYADPYTFTWTNAAAGTNTVTAKATDSIGGTATSLPIKVIVRSPPLITQQPLNQTVQSGGTVTFSVIAYGTAPLTYRWKRSGTNLNNGGSISGATNAILTIANVCQNDAGKYSVAVSNAVGNATSTTAILSVDGSLVFSENFESGITNWAIVPGATSLDLSSTQPNPLNGLFTAHETNSLNKMYYNFGTEVSGRARATYWIYDTGSEIRAFGEVRGFAGSGLNDGALQQVLAIGLHSIPFAPGAEGLESTDGSRYHGRVVFGTYAGWFNLNGPGAPFRSVGWHQFALEKSADGTAIHFFVDGTWTRTISEAVPVTWDSVEIGSAGIGWGANSVSWFDDVKVENLTAVITNQPLTKASLAGGSVTFTVGATGSNLTYQWRKNGVSISGATTSALTFSNVQASDVADYSVIVATSTDREYSTIAKLIVPTTPVITQQPSNLTVGPGDTAQFSVQASGGALSYQWTKNGANISNATRSALTLSAVSQADVASYRVIITNLAGSVTSAIATLTVNEPPVITSQPAGSTVVAGSLVTLSVTAIGATPLNYQWKKNNSPLSNGGNLSGVSTPTLSLAAISSTDAGTYTVTITNQYGSVTSAPAILLVNVAPSITTQPASQSVAEGGTASFNVVASGTASLSYQWLWNGFYIPGATASSYVRPNVRLPDAGSYSVVVGNSAGTITSAAATLTVDVGVANLMVDGSIPGNYGPITVVTNTTVILRAVPSSIGASFNANQPVWSIVSQPGSLSAPSAGSVTGSFTPVVPGQYVISASSSLSTQTITINVVDSSDADYNGWPDSKESVYSPLVPQTQLGSWRFDTPDWISLQGCLPLSYTNLQMKSGWSIGAVVVTSNSGPAKLVYPEINTNTSMANISLREGSLRFWFRPNWSSGNTGGPGGSEARLIEVGTKGTANGCWGLYLNSTGTNLYFCTQTNSGTITTNLASAVSWVNNEWHHVTLTYSATNSSLFLDGVSVATGTGVSNWPSSTIRSQGFTIGTDINGSSWAQGRFDSLETFNYAIPSNHVSQYLTTYTNGFATKAKTNFCELAPIALSFSTAQVLTNGQIFYVTNGTSTGNSGWLKWTNDNSAGYLESELTNMSLSITDYDDPITHSHVIFIDGNVAGLPGKKSSGGVASALNALISNSNVFGVVLWDGTNSIGSGQGFAYQIAGFANVRLIDYGSTANEDYFQIEYRGPRSCDGYFPNIPPVAQLVSPADNQVFSTVGIPAKVPITAAAYDSEDGLKNVAFYSTTDANLPATLLYYVSFTNACTNVFTYVWTNAPHGTNYVWAQATDELGATSKSSTNKVIVNWPPTVTAGANQTVLWNEQSSSLPVTLAGYASDDGLPANLATAWSVISSNGTVTFGNSTVTNTTATFTNYGVYVLQLTANDGAVTVTNRCQITVQRRPAITITNPVNGVVFTSGAQVTNVAVASGWDTLITNVQFFNGATSLGFATAGPGSTFSLPWSVQWGTNNITARAKDYNGNSATSTVVTVYGNTLPSVTAGPNQTFIWNEGAVGLTNTLAGYVADDGILLPVTTTWSVLSSNGTVTFSSTSLTNATAVFATNGTYVLQLTASDGVVSVTNSCTITILRRPLVVINTPTNGALLTMGAVVTNIATAYDLGGSVTNLLFFNGTNLLGKAAAGASNTFRLVWSGLPAGTNLLTAVATDDGGLSQTSAAVTVYGNVPPTVIAGHNKTLIWDENRTTLTNVLAGNATDEGFPAPLTNVWTVLSSNGPVTIASIASTNTEVVFSTNGTYVFRLTAGDGALTVSSSVTNKILRRPFISITSPTNYFTVAPGQLITNKANAYDYDGTITNVQFFNGSDLIGTTTTGVGNIYTVVWTNAPIGTNWVKAIAKDNDGLSSTSAPVAVVVTVPLVVQITHPVANTNLVAPASVRVDAMVSNAVNGVQMVEFFSNGVKVGQDSVSTTNPYSFTLVGLGVGDYTLRATATDGTGATATSANVPIKVLSAVQVDPGTNQTIVLTGQTVTNVMNGRISGGTGTYTSLWAQVVGPATGTIVSPGLTNSSIIFSKLGTYLFRLTGGDGLSQDSKVMTVLVASNKPPVVDAGPNRIIAPNQTALLIGSVSDDGLPFPPSINSWWSIVSGPVTNIVFTNISTPLSLASNFTVQGVYRLRLTASDGLATNSAEMTVTVADPNSRTYTFDADFAEGELVNVNYTDLPNQLQLNRSIEPFPFVWIACSARNTVVKIDANTGEILGEYRSAPAHINADPSRTTVDRYGNAWVCNRQDNLLDPTSGNIRGSITRIGLVIGGVRGYKTNDLGGTNYVFVADPRGQYLQPPFKYCTVTDRDGDELIRTSVGLGDVLAWDTNSIGTDDQGGISLAKDECIINYTRTAGHGMRTIAIDANNDLWVGGHDWAGGGDGLSHLYHQKVNGVTGLPVPNTTFDPIDLRGGYGGLIDGNGILWSANSLMRFDISRRFNMSVNPPAVVDPNYVGEAINTSSYGIGIDPKTGDIWCSSQRAKISPDGTRIQQFSSVGIDGGGIAVDDQGNVWIASHSGGNGVGHYRTDGTFVGNVYFGCQEGGYGHGPTGVAIDANGKIWTANMNSSTAMRINPNKGPRMLNGELNSDGYLLGEVELTVNLDAPGQNSASPYNYSDMTGYISLGATEPSGLWRVIHSGSSNQTWGKVTWTSTEPAGTKIKVEVRAAERYLDLQATTNDFIAAIPASVFTNELNQLVYTAPLTNVAGQFIEIRTVLSHKLGTNASPVLKDLTISSDSNAVIANTANICNSDRVTMFENGGPLTINVLANDLPPAGSQLTIAKVSPPANGYIRNLGTNLVYIPNTNFYGVDRFTYTALDGQGAVGRAVVTVVVGQVPKDPSPSIYAPPVAPNTNVLVIGNVSSPVAINVMEICSDTNSPTPLGIHLQSASPAHHGYTWVENCQLYYLPDAGYFGADSFAYYIANSQALTATGRVSIIVSGRPTVPIECGENITNRFTITNTAYSTHRDSSYAHVYEFLGNSTNSQTIAYPDTMSLYVYDPYGNEVTGVSPSSSSGTNYWQFVPRESGYYLAEITPVSIPSDYFISLTCTNSSVPRMSVLLGTSIIPRGGGVDYVTQMGQPVAATLTITNNGTAALTIDQISATYENGNFTVGNTELTNAGITVAANSSSNLVVFFNALPGEKTNSQITFYNNDLQYVVNLYGRANPTNTIPPVVYMTGPTFNSNYTAFGTSSCGEAIHIGAHATTSATGVNIWSVNFYARTTNGQNILLQQVLNSGSMTEYSFDWSYAPVGNYELFAVAVDNTGLQTVSTNVPISVSARPSGSPRMAAFFFGTNALPSESGIDFGVLLTNTAQVVTLTVSNAGGGTLTNWFDTTWTNPSDHNGFYITNSLSNPFKLATGAYTNLYLRFQSDSTQLRAATLEFENNDQGSWNPSIGDCEKMGAYNLHLSGIATNFTGAPSVALTNPIANAIFISPGTINLKAVATASGPGVYVSAVDFYVVLNGGYGFIGRGSVDGNVYSLSWSDVSPGNYTLVAVATDSIGRRTISSQVAITVVLRPSGSPVMQVFVGTNSLLNRSTVDLGLATVGTPVITMLTISNAGASSLVLSNYEFQSGSCSAFTLSNSPAFPISIPTNGATNLYLICNPDSASWGEKCTAVLVLTNGDVASNPFLLTNVCQPTAAGTPPTVSITNPIANQTLIWPINISATASAASGKDIYSIGFWLKTPAPDNGYIYLGEQSQASPAGVFTLVWDSSNPVPPGNYTLFAVATDTAQVQAMSSGVPITIPLRGTNSPILKIFLGTNEISNLGLIDFGTVVSGTAVPFTLTLTNAGPVTFTNESPYVGLFGSGVSDGGYFELGNSVPLDGFILAPAASTNFNLILHPNSSGVISNSLRIEGNDDALLITSKLFSFGMRAISSNATFATTLLSPADGATIIYPNPVSMHASVSFPSLISISSVNFYSVSGSSLTFLGSGSGTGGNWYFSWANALPGQYVLRAVAFDNQGRAAASQDVSVSVVLRPTNSPVMGVFVDQTNAAPNRSTIDFGLTQVGSPATTAFTITNSGNTSLNISKVLISNTNDFVLDANFEFPLTIPVNASTNFSIVYRAIAPGEANCVLSIYNDDPASHPFFTTNIARANPANGVPAPVVQLTAPADGLLAGYPANITISAIASCSSNSTLGGVNFVASSSSGAIQIGQVLAGPNLTNMSATITWSRPAPGSYAIRALAFDRSGIMGQSSIRTIQVIDPDSGSTNLPPASDMPPVAREDHIRLVGCFANCGTYRINVLANDSDPNNFPLTLTGFRYPEGQPGGMLGHLEQQGNILVFTPNQAIQGTNRVPYFISNGRGGTATGWLEIRMQMMPLPHIELLDPQDQQVFFAEPTELTNRYIMLRARAFATDPTVSIARVSFYDNFEETVATGGGSDDDDIFSFDPHSQYESVQKTVPIGSVTVTNGGPDIYEFKWQTPRAGRHRITAYVLDSVGQENLADAYLDGDTITSHGAIIDVMGKLNNILPIAAITNLAPTVIYDADTKFTRTSYPIVTNGVLDILGQAFDSESEDQPYVSYQIQLMKPDGTLVADITPSPTAAGWHVGGDIAGVLATNVDLSLYENGVYDVVLNVFDGWEVSTDTARILLNTQLKIGQFSFSVQDVVLPVGGMPLTLVRTYNSFDVRKGDFGYCWSYSLNDVNLQLDEFRERTAEADTGEDFSLRVGGGRNVTLTLPDGRRTAFQFYFGPAVDCGDFDGVGRYCYPALWQGPRGVNYTLTTVDRSGNIMTNYFNALTGLWNNQDGTGFENYDFPGYALIASDGTKYIIQREDEGDHFFLSGYNGDYYAETYGKGALTQIIQPDNNRIVIQPDNIQHYDSSGNPTRRIRFERDQQNRITAVYDPNSGSNGLPLLTYIYGTNGNLIQVEKLVDRNANSGFGSWESTFYQYTNSHFPHFITGIIDPRGVQVARQLFDDSGRLIGVIDAAGRTNRLDYDILSGTQTVYDRKGTPTVYKYDFSGNVLWSMDVYGHTNCYSYDTNGALTSFTDALGNKTSFSNDASGNVLSVTLPYPDGADPAAYTTSFTWDTYGNQTSIRLPAGGVVTNLFDANGKLRETRDGDGNLISATTYNSQGLPDSESDKFSTNKFGYDAMGNLKWLTNSLGQVTTSGFDPNGNLTALTDLRTTNILTYDAQGRQQAADYGGGITVSNSYQAQVDWNAVDGPTIGHMERRFDDDGRLSGWTTVNGGKPSFGYDPNGKLEYETNSIGAVTRMTYNLIGWIVAKTNLTTGAWATYGYDDAGRKIAETNAYGQVTRFAYWPSGSLKAMTNATGTNYLLYTDAAGACSVCGNSGTITDTLGRVIETVQTPHGLLSQTIRRASSNAAGDRAATNTITYLDGLTTPDQEAGDYPATTTDEGGRTRRFGYTSIGQLMRATDLGGAVWWTNQFDGDTGALTNLVSPTGESLTYTYDDLDNVKTIRFADGFYLTNFYNAENRLSGVVLPTGVALTNSYDFAGRLQSQTSSIGETAVFSYNVQDIVTSMSDNTGTTINGYDAAGRRVNIVYPTGARVDYGYDLLDRIVAVTNRASFLGSNYVTRYQYDIAGNITNVIDPFNGNTGFEYDAVGRKTRRKLPNGTTTSWEYDWKNQITNIVHKTSSGTVLASMTYERAPGGEPTKITREDGSYAMLAYDAALRLTNEVYYTGAGVAQITNSYGYDAAGSRIKVVKGNQVLTNGIAAGYRITVVKDASNSTAVETYGYDNGGRVTSISRDNTTWNLKYSSSDQVTAVTNGSSWVTYQHDAIGRRTISTNSAGIIRKFLVAPTPGTDLESPHIIIDGNGMVQQGYVYIGDEPIMRFDSSGSVIYYLEDAMGSVSALVNSSQTKIASFDYDGFGNVRSSSGSTTVPSGAGGDFRFHGAWFEEGSGLYHMRAREYDPRLGRFTSRDSRNGVFQRPETLQPYVYGLNNPFVFTDPSGEFTITEITAENAINMGIEAFKNVAISHAKGRIKEAIQNMLANVTMDAMKALFPEIGDLFGKLKRNPGKILEDQLKAAICGWVPGESITKYLWFMPGVNRNGVAKSSGLNCPNVQAPGFEAGLSYPDYVIGEAPPKEVSKKRAAPSYLIGDIKLSGNSLFIQYVDPGSKKNQLEAIVKYARKSTEFRCAVFLTFFTGERKNLSQVGVKIASYGAKEGSMAFVISLVKNNKY